MKNIFTKYNDILLNENIDNNDIYLIYQFFIHKNEKRNNEILYCLKQNIKLGLFKKIILLNERIYKKEELRLNDNEMINIQQINISERLKFNNIFNYSKILKLNGYIVFCNADIFFDETIKNLHRSSLSMTKSIYTLLRFEYTNEENLKECKLYSPNNKPICDSQDTWIYHTNQLIITNKLLEQTNFMFGKPGCDNKISYIFSSNGYKCINVPFNIKTYHYHLTNIRNYTKKERIKPPYLFCKPILN